MDESLQPIPVHISSRLPSSTTERLPPTRKRIRRNNVLAQSTILPKVMNINPRSIYNKFHEFGTLLEQYESDLIFMSDTWERDHLTLDKIITKENYRVISNVKQRDFNGGKPASIVNEEKFYVRPLCPEPITVPVGVEAVWALITPNNPSNQVKHIAVASIYYKVKSSPPKNQNFLPYSTNISLLMFKIPEGSPLHNCRDTNRLNLSPILDLSGNLVQFVKITTRLNPDAILDLIITTMSRFYCDLVTKPPLSNDQDKTGKPSDHLVVLMLPKYTMLDCPPRKYRIVKFRALGFRRPPGAKA